MGRIILTIVKRRFLPQFAKDALIDSGDKRALDSVLKVLLKTLSSPFIQKNDFKGDVISVLLTVQNSYAGSLNEELKFTFSISDLIKCYFLFMSELNDILNRTTWLKTFKRSRVSTFKKINRISGYYNFLYEKIPFLKLLRKGRISGKILRIFLIPVLGLPSIVLSIIFSFVSLFFTELIWKYYYGVIIIKCTYYGIILYGDKKSLMKKKLEHVSASEIKVMAGKVEDLINPHINHFRSPYFEKSFLIYQEMLEQYGISSEKDIDFDGVQYRFNRKRRILKKIFEVPVNAFKQFNPLYEKSYSDKEQLNSLIKGIAGAYTDKKDIIDDLKIIELFEVLYMISLVGYNKLVLGSVILNNLSVDFVLKAKKINDEIFDEVLKNSIPGYKKIYRSFKLIRKSRVLYKAVRSANPMGLILSVSGPIAFEGVKSQFRDYIFQKTGRFVLYCYESNALNRDNIFHIK